ncbi:MAG: DUF488 family protein [Methanomassiliicoccales archaeon]|jgi:uncharacterized protein YeaO (DUF488 family)
MIRLKRAYEVPSEEDGTRVLVERLWPRGLTKEKAAIHIWIRDVAPSPELRKWYAHDESKWDEFRSRYRAELEGDHADIQKLMELESKGDITFILAAKAPEHSSAAVLRDYIRSIQAPSKQEQ